MCDADGGGDEDVYWHGTQGGFGEVVGERLHMPCLHYGFRRASVVGLELWCPTGC